MIRNSELFEAKLFVYYPGSTTPEWWLEVDLKESMPETVQTWESGMTSNQGMQWFKQIKILVCVNNALTSSVCVHIKLMCSRPIQNEPTVSF